MPPIFITLLWFVILAISLTILLKSADYFVFMAELLGKKFKLPSFIIGATVVAFGTSLPELAVGVVSVLKDQSDIVTGTIVGSNVANIFFITGIAILLSSGFTIRFSAHKFEFSLMLFGSILVSYFLYNKSVSILEALICLLLLVLYLIYVIKYSNNAPVSTNEEETKSISKKQYLLFSLSILGIWLGAKYTTDAITSISTSLKLGSDVISQTLLALGTSLPELAVTVAAVRSKQFGIVLGNVIGSNIFNLLAVLGLPALIGNLSKHPYLVSDEGFIQFGLPLMLLSSILLIAASFFKTTPKTFGILFLLLYIFFMVGSFMKVNLSHLI
ncbi:MAG: calcium/sodium antiporter [Chitinophagales bacterium]|nr:calcium/sodium antiporter [Chitinophagales bacterium]